jgi:hypothetical protein
VHAQCRRGCDHPGRNRRRPSVGGDGDQLVHGRPSYQPRYDGTDRWLMRVKVAVDIRRSREFRASSIDRVIRLVS